ncbi:MAG: mannose-6-phosphate isomerase-like protein (cupin superfamily) [Candidatus Poriferisodalaceae bacterium]|jgi:mannose-6-phosphate isomerase-like protein (cupin superfamily)
MSQPHTSRTDRVSVVPGQSLIAEPGLGLVMSGSGSVWGLDSRQLNANLVVLEAGSSIEAHVNNQLDVVLIVQAGSGSLFIEGQTSALAAGSVALIAAGTLRSIVADTELRYFTVHHRRGGLQIGHASLSQN